MERDLKVICEALENLANYFGTHPKLVLDSLVESGIADRNSDFYWEITETLYDREDSKRKGIN
jgi:hypothetical protein